MQVPNSPDTNTLDLTFWHTLWLEVEDKEPIDFSRDELWKAAKAVWKKTATKDKCAAAFRLKKRMLAAIVEDGGGYPRKRPKVD